MLDSDFYLCNKNDKIMDPVARLHTPLGVPGPHFKDYSYTIQLENLLRYVRNDYD